MVKDTERRLLSSISDIDLGLEVEVSDQSLQHTLEAAWCYNLLDTMEAQGDQYMYVLSSTQSKHYWDLKSVHFTE